MFQKQINESYIWWFMQNKEGKNNIKKAFLNIF